MIRFIRVILIILIIYYLVKLISRFVIPFLFKRYAKNINENTGKRKNQNYRKKKEGEVTIDYTPKEKKHFDKNSGEYIDFEEVEDE